MQLSTVWPMKTRDFAGILDPVSCARELWPAHEALSTDGVMAIGLLMCLLKYAGSIGRYFFERTSNKITGTNGT